MRRRDAHGFSLVELVIVLVLLGVLSVFAADLIRQPIDASADVQRRARLADAADQAMSRMSRDLRLALPNSIRSSTDGRAIELLLAPMAGRYRANPASTVVDAVRDADVLDFSTADASFALMADLPTAPAAGQWAVVYNLVADGGVANAWAGDNRATVAAGSSLRQIQLAPSFQFPFASPAQRVYFVSQAVQYRCAPDGQLLRHVGYAPTAAMQVPAATPPALVAEGASFCDFRYVAGAQTRQSLASLRLTLTREGESVSLLKSVHVPNLP